jgi:hypothetical protein
MHSYSKYALELLIHLIDVNCHRKLQQQDWRLCCLVIVYRTSLWAYILKTLFPGFRYFCTLPIIIIYFKIISVQQFEVQQLKYWKSIPSLRTIICKTRCKVLSENLFCLTLCLSAWQYLVKQQQKIGGKTQLCMGIL